MRKLVPIGKPHITAGIRRHDIGSSQQHPVEGVDGSDQSVAVFRKDNLVDQGIDTRILYTGIIARSRRVGTGRPQ